MSVRPTLLYRVVAGAGLGHVLVSILNGAMKALELGRDFAIDASEFQYFAADRHRQFCDCFALEAPPGLRVITDAADLAALRAMPDRREILVRGEINRLAGAAERLIAVPGTILDDAYRLSDKAAPPVVRIGLRGWLRDRVADSLQRFEQGAPVIGLYFRHGNGEFLNGRFDAKIFPNHAVLLADLRQRYAALARQIAADRGWPDARFFIASDNAGFVADMRQMLPNAFSLATMLPKENYKDHVRRNAHAPEILFEAVQDMWALSACRALVHNASLFSHFAALNSVSLASESMFDVKAPDLLRLMTTLPPAAALEQARMAYAAVETMQTLEALGYALRRNGDTAGAEMLDRRIAWFRAVHFTSREMRTAQVAARDGRTAEAIALGLDVARLLGPNPYVLMFLARLRHRTGELGPAEAAIREAIALDDGIFGAESLLSAIMAARAGQSLIV
jgi:hypothetical protein